MIGIKRLFSAFTVLFFCMTSWLHAQEITVSAAGSLSKVFKEISAAFEKENPGVKVNLNFAAAGVLIQQIEQGAPVDVFASADQMSMDSAQKDNLIISETRKNFAQNSLVIVAPKSAKFVPSSLEDLKQDSYQLIALGRPGLTPAGNYIQALLKQNGLWDELEPRFVMAEHVMQVTSYLDRQEADVGFIFMTDFLQNQNIVQMAFIASTENDFIYPIARTKNASQPELADQFIEFVVGSQGQNILKQHGFSVLNK